MRPKPLVDIPKAQMQPTDRSVPDKRVPIINLIVFQDKGPLDPFSRIIGSHSGQTQDLGDPYGRPLDAVVYDHNSHGGARDNINGGRFPSFFPRHFQNICPSVPLDKINNLLLRNTGKNNRFSVMDQLCIHNLTVCIKGDEHNDRLSGIPNSANKISVQKRIADRFLLLFRCMDRLSAPNGFPAIRIWKETRDRRILKNILYGFRGFCRDCNHQKASQHYWDTRHKLTDII
nr:hypothetical protein [Sneathiella chinensis]